MSDRRGRRRAEGSRAGRARGRRGRGEAARGGTGRGRTSRRALRGSIAATATLALVLVIAGLPPVQRWVMGRLADAGLGEVIAAHPLPVLRVWPGEGISGGEWAIDALGAVVAVALCWAWMRTAPQLNRRPTRGRAIRSGWMAAVVGVMVAGVLRGGLMAALAGSTLLGIAAAAVMGLLTGVAAGAVVGVLVGAAAGVPVRATRSTRSRR